MALGGNWSTLEKQMKEPLAPELVQVLTDTLKFPTMTTVQAAVIPQFCSFKDVAVEACTGSGKTLAYVIPMIQMLMKKSWEKEEILAIVITPVRELARQVFDVVEIFCKKLSSLKPLLLIGGTTSAENDIDLFKKSGGNIIVGTPGRIEVALKSLHVYTKSFEVLILDEADRILDMGFSSKTKANSKIKPNLLITKGLFSATLSAAIEDLMKAGLRNPKILKRFHKRIIIISDSQTSKLLFNL